MHQVVTFHGSDRALLAECQTLRYRVYGEDLGVDIPDLDHAARLDVEARDPVCDFAAVRSDGEVVGCVRMQPPGRGPYYAELEFELLGPTWREAAFVEGARFAVRADERGGPVPLLLFQAFRRYCRDRGIDRVLSVAIVPGARSDRARAAALTRFFRAKTDLALDRGRPARGYELEPPTEDELGRAPDLDPARTTPMVRLLANRRTTLASAPAYCSRFGTFNFLLTTRLP